MLSLLVLVLGVCVCQGLFLAQLCQIHPFANSPPDDPTRTITDIPLGCVNGTITLDWPVHHVLARFTNLLELPTSVCVRGVGDITYTFSDETIGIKDKELDKSANDGSLCTIESSARDILILMDGPPNAYYMWEVHYKVITTTGQK